jgi:hypothetical protein
MSSMFGEIDAASDTAAGQWIADVLHPFARDVGSIVPPGFAQYAEIRHAADDLENTAGHPPTELVERVAETGAAHTSTPDRCWYAIWDGYGWFNGGAMYWTRTRKTVIGRLLARRQLRAVERRHNGQRQRLQTEAATIPRLLLPQRSYYLLVGRVSYASRVQAPNVTMSESQPPNLWWPDDRSWCVASEIDLPVTYLGGPSDFIERVLRDAGDLATRVTTDDKIFGH